MKKFIIKLSIFICVVVVLDFAFGLVFQLYDHTKSDEIHRIHSIMTYETPEPRNFRLFKGFASLCAVYLERFIRGFCL